MTLDSTPTPKPTVSALPLSGMAHAFDRSEQSSLNIQAASLPQGAGPTASAARIPEHAAHIEEQTRKHPRTFLHINARSILSTLKLMKSGFGAMDDLRIEKSKGIGVIPATIGFILAGSSILVQAAIKAIIWMPLAIGTAVVGGTAAFIGAALGKICAVIGRDPSLALKGAELGFSIGDKAGWILGTAGVTLSAFSIVARWPLMLTSELGISLLKKSAPDDKELQEKRGFLIDLADTVAYEDVFLLWRGGEGGVWSTVAWNVRKKEKRTSELNTDRILQALEAGANLYSHNAGGNALRSKFEIHQPFEKFKNQLRNQFKDKDTDQQADVIINYFKQKAASNEELHFLSPTDANLSLSLEYRLQVFASYTSYAAENSDFRGLTETIKNLISQGATLLGQINSNDEEELLASHQRLLGHLEDKWNEAFQKLTAQCNALTGSEETILEDLNVLQNAYNQLSIFDSPDLTNIHQFKQVLEGIQDERRVLEKKINFLKEKLNASASKENNNPLAEDVAPPAEDVHSVTEENALEAAQVQTSDMRENVEQDLENYTQEKERCRQDKAGLQKLMEAITSNPVREKFTKMGKSKELRGLMEEIRSLTKELNK